jgi:biopolymer transport protein ExbD
MVTRDGGVYFRNTRINSEELPSLICRAVLDGAERRAYLKVDTRAKYADVKTIVGLLNQAGIRDVTFLVEKQIPR